MSRTQKLSVCCGIVLSFLSSCLLAVEKGSMVPSSINCHSSAGQRQHCPANTESGVILQNSIGSANCLLGKTWGYDDKGVWVKDGCSGDFLVGQAGSGVESEAVTSSTTEEREKYDTWGTFTPGKGFLLGRSDEGEASLSAYALIAKSKTRQNRYSTKAG